MVKSNDLTSQLLPTIITSRGVLAMLVTSQILACVLAFSPMSYEDVWVRLGMFSLFIHCVSAVGFSILYFLQAQLSRCNMFSQATVIIIIFECITATLSIAVPFLTPIEGLEVDGSFVLKNMTICLFVSLLFIHSMSIFLDKLQTVEALSQVELEALSARIRPHFLYNSLNTIAELTHIDKNHAEQAVITLAQLCKATMCTQQLSSLNDELQLARQYVELERWRFSERLSVNWSMPSSIPNVQIPVLSVQPLLENAVIYGVETNPELTQIDIELTLYKRQIELKICNSYHHTDVHSHQGQGMAQNNIRARLALHFGNKATLQTQQTQDKYTALLIIPIGEKS
ncbi:sensor histidine kinase [Pseudoalteromonas holothuriae]|nr:histidine kinase [Pseudoalteromonas sp. CIP111951]